MRGGLRRPWKRNKGVHGRVGKELIRPLRRCFDHLKIPHYQAPDEAEAEWSQLQQLSVVDALRSDDGDALMFGCTTLIQQHRAGKEPVKDMIEVSTANNYRRQHPDFDRDIFLLFTILIGGSDRAYGLRGCRAQAAKLVADGPHSPTQTTGHAQQHELADWSRALELTPHLRDKHVQIPGWLLD